MNIIDQFKRLGDKQLKGHYIAIKKEEAGFKNTRFFQPSEVYNKKTINFIKEEYKRRHPKADVYSKPKNTQPSHGFLGIGFNNMNLKPKKKAGGFKYGMY